MPTSRSTRPRTPAAASTASTSRRCTARRPTARCSRTTCGRRSSAASCGSPTSRSSAPPARKFAASRRWCAGTTRLRGPISPDKFIPLAEECGLIGAIGTWVLQTALEEAAQLARPASASRSICRRSSSTTRRSSTSLPTRSTRPGVRAERLELEITEGVFLADGEATDETFAG